MNKSEIKNIDLFLFDMDGTLYLGNKLFSFTKETLETINNKGKKYLFITNNSSKSVTDYVKKLENMGINATEDDFLTSSQATSYYLKKYHYGKKLYVCGTASLKAELLKEGFCITEDIDDTQCVVLGFDTELNFKKIEDVCKILLKKDVPYIATNPDTVCPTEYGSVPDCGSLSVMLENSVHKMPEFIGKPSALMVNLAIEKMGTTADKTAVVGDRIYTDIKSGLNAGAKTILVMSGETTPEILAASADKPHLVLKDCGEILDAIK